MCDYLETVGYQYDGGFAEFKEIPSRAFRAGNVTKLIDFIKDEEAALAEPVACVLNTHGFPVNLKLFVNG